MIKRASIALVGIFFTSAPALGFDPDCSDPGNLPQQGMNYCAAKEFERADAALNAAWKLLRPTATKASDGSDPMLQAQRAWIRYRDGQCDAEGLHFEGGSLEPFIVAQCRTRMTQARTQELLLMERYR
ncbi:MAG: lysozyme inhibitor LprI family protein [Pseudomonadota bacterium]